MNYNNNNACRLCTQESSRLRPLFNDNEDIISKLRILAPAVEVTAVDGLSNNVCERCVTQLNSSCEFKTLLEATYASLRERWQIQDAAFNEVLYIKDEPIPDEIEPEIAAIEVNETREAANDCNNELDPLSIKLEEASSSSLSSCTEVLSQSGSLSRHGKEEIHCKECKRKFTTEAGLKAHSSCHKICHDNRVHVEHSFCCPYCDKTFNTERGLKIHSVKYHVKEQEYRCSVCNKTFTSEMGLNRHAQSHTDERQHECSICKERFETGIDLRLHSRSHASIHDALPNPVFACPTCGKQFATTKAMKIHRRFCSKSTTIVSHSYIKKSTNLGSFECSYCNKLFIKEKAVRTHEIHCRKWQNSGNETLQMSFKSHSALQYACTLCSESFSSLSDLIRHRGVHFKTHDPETSVLQQKLPTTMHESPHSSKEKDINALPSFARSSATSGNLLSTHKPHKFGCAVCKQEFNTCKGLAVHRWRNHHEIEDSNIKLTDAKPDSTATSDKTIYQCSVCKIDFDSSRALSMHRWHRHRPELQQHRSTLNYIPQRHKPGGIYMCRLCDKRFNTNKERIIHNLTYHGFKKKLIKGYSASHNTSRDTRIRSAFTCRVCMQIFTSRTLLVKHKWDMHRAKQQKANRSNQDMSAVTDSLYSSNEKYFACSICNKYFTSKRLLSKHKWYEHKYKVNKLANMLKSVPNKFKEVNDPKHTCFICKINFNSLKSLAKHKRYRHRHRNQESMSISDVYKKITSKEHSYHLGYICHPCDRGFKSSRALSLHNCKTHRKQGPGDMDSILNNGSDTEDVEMYKCNICSLKLTSYRSLAAHGLLHRQRETGYPSQKPSTAQLSHNMDSVTTSDDKQCSSYSCPKCPCTFDDLLTFKSHQKLCGSSDANKKTDNSAKTWTVHSCKLCSMSFNSSSELIAHSNSHAESQDGNESQVVSASVATTHTCTICMQTFESEQCLVAHSEVHENHQKNCFNGKTRIDNFNKPTLDQPSGACSNIQCHICSNVFKNAQEYEVHFTTIHSQNTAEENTSLIQENDVCQKREAQSDNVDDSAERNYISCTVCSKMFASLNGFLVHNTKCHARNEKNSESENVAIPTDSSENIEHELQNSHNSCLHLNDLCCNVCQKTFRSSHGLLIHNGKVHPISDLKEGTRHEKKEGLSDIDEQIDNNEVIAAYNAENIKRNTSHSKISVSHSGANAHEDELCISSENQQVQKLQNNGEDRNLQIQQQEDSNVSEIQVENVVTSSFQCTVCSKEFATHRNMLIHKRMAHRQQNDPTLDSSNTDIVMDDSTLESTKQHCNLCPRTFKHARSLLFHKSFFHKSVLNSWDDKNANNEMRRVLEISENDKEFKEIQMEAKSKMDGISPKVNSKRCNICFREFRSFHGVLVHYAMTHQKHKIGDSLNEDKEENFSGAVSDEINTAHTPNALKFYQTESSINEDIDTQCNVCTKTLKSPHGLLIHMKKVHPSINTNITGKDSLHQCVPCGRTFVSQHALSIHYTKFHCKNAGKNIMYSEIYRCSLCSATFTSLKGLGAHSARFHGIPQSEEKNESLQNILYKCKACFKLFRKKALLKTHVQEVHQSTDWEGQPFKQKAIDPEFSTEDIDPDISTEDFDYGCVSCSKNFSSLIDLKKHSYESHKINSDGEILNISFNKDDNLGDDDDYADVETEATDMTVSKPLRCPICEKVSYSFVGLKIHCKRAHQTHWNDLETSQFVTIDFSEESNTADELLKCSVCDKLFSSPSDLQVHSETAHAAVDMESVDMSFIDNNAVSHKDENSLPSMDISLSESPRMHMNIEGNRLKQQQKINYEGKSQDI